MLFTNRFDFHITLLYGIRLDRRDPRGSPTVEFRPFLRKAALRLGANRIRLFAGPGANTLGQRIKINDSIYHIVR